MKPLRALAPLLLLGCQDPAVTLGPTAGPASPNVVLIMTDDQGWGDFGFHGNPVLDTPALDALAAESARLDGFYVHPVCTPTRAALMTGRYPQRTRAFDTWVGRAMMDPAEVTVAEALREAGWATGIFGKWHLGDCYPMRPMDQGFEESLVHRGGGIGQPADPEGGEGKYTDPVLFHNGARVDTEGYCTDVYFDAAIDWMQAQHEAGRPFFTYLATNAPHGPFHDVPEELLAKYRSRDLSPAFRQPEDGHPLPTEFDADKLARIFAMIENIDQNVAKLGAALEEMGAAQDTLVLFLVDNGPNTRRHVGGRRGMKSQVYEGGVRSPLWASWPRRLTPGSAGDCLAADIDLMPTILEACGVPSPAGLRLDGRSLMPLLERDCGEWNDRAVVIQAHRGDRGVRYHNFLLRTQRWKLLNASGFGREQPAGTAAVEPAFELYDMAADPLELHDLAATHPEVVAELRSAYDRWFDDVSTTRLDNWAPPPIVLGAPEAPEVVLTRQDWRKLTGGGWSKDAQGEWHVEQEGDQYFRVRIRFLPDTEVQRLELVSGPQSQSYPVESGSKGIWLLWVKLGSGVAPLRVDLHTEDGVVGPYQVVIKSLGELLPRPENLYDAGLGDESSVLLPSTEES